MTQQWGLFDSSLPEPLWTYPTEAAARNDPASLNGHIRVRSTSWEPGASVYGPWLATDPDDPLWGPRTTGEMIGPGHAGRALLALALALVAAGLVGWGVLWAIWVLVAG